MGPSGSGKTTLLDVLAGRKTAGKTIGSILFAGVPPTTMFLRRYTGYVEQFGEHASSCQPLQMMKRLTSMIITHHRAFKCQMTSSWQASRSCTYVN